jgi:hypothetical protein
MPDGFTASQVANHVRRQSTSEKDYGPRQAAYDLKKFRGKDVVRLVGTTRRYEASPDGLKMMSALMVLRDKVLRPLIAAALITDTSPAATHPTALDRHYEAIRHEMRAVFSELGLAA